MRPPLQRATGLASVLRGVIAEMQQASKADIVSIFLYDEAARRYFAPFATGQPQESLLDSLADMSEQLARYTADAGAGKVPDDLGIHNYGSTVRLTVPRQKLVARAAPHQPRARDCSRPDRRSQPRRAGRGRGVGGGAEERGGGDHLARRPPPRRDLCARKQP